MDKIIRTRQPPVQPQVRPVRPPIHHLLHEVRAVATNTGFKYYFDAYGNVYIWFKGALKIQHPHRLTNKQTLLHNKNGGYLQLHHTSGKCFGASNRGQIYVHRGVAMAFPEICGVPNLIQNQVDHRNWEMYDNRARNLRWLSPSENTKHKKQS